MKDVLLALYPWLKAGHIIFVIFWMAGLFMMGRFLVYHQESAPDSEEWARWAEREARLRRIILGPSLVVVWVLGLALAWSTGALAQGWFHLKLLLVLLLSGYHGWMIAYARRLAAGRGTLGSSQLRLLNEVPGMAAAVIVVLAVVRPF